MTRNPGAHASAKAMILKLLQSRPATWFFSYELEKVDTPFGWIGTQGTRRARELAQAGAIERRIKDGLVQYRIKERQTQMRLEPEVETLTGFEPVGEDERLVPRR